MGNLPPPPHLPITRRTNTGLLGLSSNSSSELLEIYSYQRKLSHNNIFLPIFGDGFFVTYGPGSAIKDNMKRQYNIKFYWNMM